MMNDMKLNNVVEHVLADEAKLTIHCGSGALEECPGFGFEFGEVGMRMV